LRWTHKKDCHFLEKGSNDIDYISVICGDFVSLQGDIGGKCYETFQMFSRRVLYEHLIIQRNE
jgi:hypothetical protein